MSAHRDSGSADDRAHTNGTTTPTHGSSTSSATKSASTWKGKFATLFGTKDKQTVVPVTTPTAITVTNGPTSTTSQQQQATPAISASQQQQTTSTIHRISATSPTTTPTHSHRNSRTDISTPLVATPAVSSTAATTITVASPRVTHSNAATLLSPFDSSSAAAAAFTFDPLIRFDAELSNGLIFSAVPTDAQMEAYLMQLSKLMQHYSISSSSRDKHGRVMRQRAIEEMAKVCKSFSFSDLRVILDIITSLLQQYQATSDDSYREKEHHAAMHLLLTCLETQSQEALSSYRTQLFTLLTEHSSHLPARLCGLSLLTRNGRECAPFSTYLAKVLNEWIATFESLGVLVNSYPNSITPSVPPPSVASSSTAASTSVVSSSFTSFHASQLSIPSNADSPVLTFYQLSPSDRDSYHVIHRNITHKLLLLLLRFVTYHYSTMGESMLCAIILQICRKCEFEHDVIIQSFLIPFFRIVVQSGIPMMSDLSAPNSAASTSNPLRSSLLYSLCLCVNISSRDSWNVMKILLESAEEGIGYLHALLKMMKDLALEYANGTTNMNSNTVSLSSSVIASVASSSSSSSPPSTSSSSLLHIRALRGGVFLIAMSTWSSSRLSNLTSYPFVLILSAFDECMKRTNHMLVAYEIILAVRRLIKKYAHVLNSIEWSLLLSILHHSSDLIKQQQRQQMKSQLIEIVQEILCGIEELWANSNPNLTMESEVEPPSSSISISSSQFFTLMFSYSSLHSSSLKLRLLSHISHHLFNPLYSSSWLTYMRNTIDVFYHSERDVSVKHKVVQIIEHAIYKQKYLYAEEIVREAVLGCLLNPSMQSDDSTLPSSSPSQLLELHQSQLLLLSKILCDIPTITREQFQELARLIYDCTRCDTSSSSTTSFNRVASPTPTSSSSSLASHHHRHGPAELKELRFYSSTLLIHVFYAVLQHEHEEYLHLLLDHFLVLVHHGDKSIRYEVLEKVFTRISLNQDGKLVVTTSSSSSSQQLQQQHHHLLMANLTLSSSVATSLSTTLVQSLLKRLHHEMTREIFELVLETFHSLCEGYYLMCCTPEAMQSNLAAIMHFTCDLLKHMSDERRMTHQKSQNHRDHHHTSKMNGASGATSTTGTLDWSIHWHLSSSVCLSFLHNVRGLIGNATRMVPQLIEQLMQQILSDIDDWSNSHLNSSSNSTKDSTPSRSSSHSVAASMLLTDPKQDLIDYLQVYVELLHVIFLSTQQHLHSRYVTQLLDRFVKLIHSPSSAVTGGGLSDATIVSILQFIHFCSYLRYSTSTLANVQQVCVLSFPFLSTSQPSPLLIYWSSRAVAGWLVTLSLEDRQSLVPSFHLALTHRTSSSKQAWNLQCTCLLDFVNRHAYWRADPNTIHLTQHAMMTGDSSRIRDATSSLYFPPSSTQQRSFLSGLSLCTIRIGILDYVEITVRRTSGTSSWIMRFTRSAAGMLANAPIYLPKEIQSRDNQVGVDQVSIVDSSTSLPHHHPDSSPTTPHRRLTQPSRYEDSPAHYIPPSSPGEHLQQKYLWPSSRTHSTLATPTQQLIRNASAPNNGMTSNSALPLPSDTRTPISRQSLRAEETHNLPTLTTPIATRAREVTDTNKETGGVAHSAMDVLKLDESQPSSTVASPPLDSAADQSLVMQVHVDDESVDLLPRSRQRSGAPSSEVLEALPEVNGIHVTPSSTRIQPVPRRATVPTSLNFVTLPSDNAVATESPRRSPLPRSSTDSSPHPPSDPPSSQPSPSPVQTSRTAFSHHSSSPFRSAVRISSPNVTSPITTIAQTKDNIIQQQPRHSRRVSINSSHHVLQNRQTTTAIGSNAPCSTGSSNVPSVTASPLQPTPIRLKKLQASPTSSLSLLTQAFSNQKQAAANNASRSSIAAVTPSSNPLHSTLLAQHGLPASLASNPTSSIMQAHLEQMWSILDQFEKDDREEEEERKVNRATQTKGHEERNEKYANSMTFEPEFILSHLQSQFPDLSASPNASSDLGRSDSWLSLSSLDSQSVSVALSVLDSTPIRDTLKVGVLYVGRGQRHELEILHNSCGSAQYQTFLQSLGDMVTLRGETRYVGGLDTQGNRDGEVTVLYSDMTHEMVFHISTFLPARSTHANFENKRRLIGNDYILIAYVEQGGEYSVNTLTSQTVLVHIVVQPLTSSEYQVSLLYKHADHTSLPGSRVLPHRQLVEVSFVAEYVRHLCMTLEVSCQAFLAVRSAVDHASLTYGNQEQRCQQIQLLRTRLQASIRSSSSSSSSSSIIPLTIPNTSKPANLSSSAAIQVPHSSKPSHPSTHLTSQQINTIVRIQ